MNDLTLDRPCIVTMAGGQSVVGVYGGGESIHDDWFILVTTDDASSSLLVSLIVYAAS